MSFTELAKAILKDAENLDNYISANNLPKPSFDVDGPVRIPYSTPEANESLSTLLANTHKLSYLAQGPIAPWTGTMNGAAGDTMTIATIYHFQIANHVPIEGKAAFEEVAQKSGMSLRDFSMVVRYAMTNFIFCEPTPGFIAHTASSKVLAENKLVKALTAMGANELLPGLFKVIEI